MSYRSPCRWPYPVIHPAADLAAVPVIHPAVRPAADFHAHHDSSAVRFVRCSSVLFNFVDSFSLPSSPCCDVLNPSQSSPYGDIMFVRSFVRCSTPWHVFDCVVSRRRENGVSRPTCSSSLFHVALRSSDRSVLQSASCVSLPSSQPFHYVFIRLCALCARRCCLLFAGCAALLAQPRRLHHDLPHRLRAHHPPSSPSTMQMRPSCPRSPWRFWSPWRFLGAVNSGVVPTMGVSLGCWRVRMPMVS